MTVEIRAKLKLQHGGLLRWLHENNVQRRELAEILGVSYETLNGWINLRSRPSKKYHEKLEDITGESIVDLFPHWFKPAELKQLAADKGETVKYLTEADMRMLQAASAASRPLLLEDQFEMQDTLDTMYKAMSDVLSPKEERIIRMRLEGETYDGIGATFRVSRERVRQIEKKGLQKLKKRILAGDRA